jgi:hypothetical protein
MINYWITDPHIMLNVEKNSYNVLYPSGAQMEYLDSGSSVYPTTKRMLRTPTFVLASHFDDIVSGGKGDTSKKSFSPNYWVYFTMFLHTVALIVVTVFVSILFSQLKNNEKFTKNNIQILSSGWITSPLTCKYWINGMCLQENNAQSDPISLGKDLVTLEVEQPATGLFSTINAPFFCLAVMVLSTSFVFSCSKIEYEDLTPKMLKSISLLLLVVYGVFFLFIQNQWNIPFNNLILVEALYLISFLLINLLTVKQHHMHLAIHFFNTMLTNPLIAVSVLSVLGQDNTMSLLFVFFTLTIANAFLVLLNNENAVMDTMSSSQYVASFVGKSVWAYWICMLPFQVECSLRFEYMLFESPLQYPTWALTGVALLFLFFSLEGIYFSIEYGLYWYYERSLLTSAIGKWMLLLQYIAKIILIFIVILGFYSEFK